MLSECEILGAIVLERVERTGHELMNSTKGDINTNGDGYVFDL